MALNKVMLQGRCVADPDLKTIGEDTAVSSVRIAVDRDYVEKGTGERKADFISVVAWRSTATFLNKYFHKGDQLIVDGKLQVREWEDKDGNKRYSTEVIADNIYFCGSKQNKDSVDAAPARSSAAAPAYDDDDGLPF